MRIILVICSIFCVATTFSQTKVLNEARVATPISITPSIDWNKEIGVLTADHWGVNDAGAAIRSVNHKMAEFYQQIKPGMIRLHHNKMVESFVDNENKCWNREKIREVFENSRNTYKYGDRVMVTFDNVPSFIATQMPLTEEQEDQTAAFFAEFPIIVKELGYWVNYYEFFNEKEKPYQEDYDAYWRVLNKIAIAMREAEPKAKYGGPAVSWPWVEIYEGFLDNCQYTMDFFSFHLYARGPKYNNAPGSDLFTGEHAYPLQVEAAKAVVEYMKEKKIKDMELFLNEYHVQYSWQPYETSHHNNIGAAWMACFVKNVGLTGIDALNVWNTQDSGAYGLNYNSAPANLFLMSTPYLRGKVVESSEKENRVEMIPIISSEGRKSILLINKTKEILLLADPYTLIPESEGQLKAFRLDETTRIEDKVYDILPIKEIKAGIELHSYGMVLVTNIH